MFDLGKFGAEIELDSNKFNKGMADAEGKTKSFSGKLGGFAKSVGKIATGAIVAFSAALTGAFAATKKVTNAFDDIAKNSTKMGISTDYYQEMEYWASQNGISHNNMEKALGRLNQRMGLAVDGNEKYSDALTKLGVNMDDVKDGTVSTEDAMTQTIKSLSEMDNEQQKAALASELFGTKLSRELMPALQDGSLSIEEAKEKAQELGLVIEEDTLHAAEDFNDTWDDLTRMMGAFGQKIIAKLMPTFQLMMDWVIDHMPQIQQIAGKAFDAVGKAVGYVADFIRDILYPALVDLWEWFEPHLPMIQELFENAFGLAKDIIEKLIEVVIEITEWFVEHWAIVEPILAGIAAGVVAFQLITGAMALWTTATTIATGAVGAFSAVMAFVTSPIGIAIIAIGAVIAIGVALYKNWDKVTEKLKKLWDNVKKFFSKIGEFIADTWDKTIQGFKNLWTSAKEIFNNVKNAIMNPIKTAKDNVIKFVGSIFTGAVDKFNSLKDSATRIFNKVKDAIVKPINKARDLIGGAIDKVKGFFSGLKLSFPKLKMPKLPKFSLKGKFGLAPPSVPKLSIDWFKDGGIMTKPTAFGRNGNNIMAGGEAGAEAIIPLRSDVLAGIGKGISMEMSNPRDNNQSNQLLAEQNKLLQALLNKDNNIYMDGHTVSDRLDSIQSTEYAMANIMAGNK